MPLYDVCQHKHNCLYTHSVIIIIIIMWARAYKIFEIILSLSVWCHCLPMFVHLNPNTYHFVAISNIYYIYAYINNIFIQMESIQPCNSHSYIMMPMMIIIIIINNLLEFILSIRSPTPVYLKLCYNDETGAKAYFHKCNFQMWNCLRKRFVKNIRFENVIDFQISNLRLPLCRLLISFCSLVFFPTISRSQLVIMHISVSYILIYHT